MLGKSTKGKSAVAARGIASLIHQVAMRTATASILPADSGKPGMGTKAKKQKRTTPTTRPMRCLLKWTLHPLLPLPFGERAGVRVPSPNRSVLGVRGFGEAQQVREELVRIRDPRR